MRMTDKADAALFLGGDMARAFWPAFKTRYPSKRLEMLGRLGVAGFPDPALPESHEDFRVRFGDLMVDIQAHFREERSQIGGDVYALPFFELSFMLHGAIAGVALGEAGNEDIRGSLDHLVGVLWDLSISASIEELETIIAKELAGAERTPHGGELTVEEEDIFVAWARILNRLMERWIEAERRSGQDMPALGLLDLPLHSCFISYSHKDEAFGKKLSESLKLGGVETWYAPDEMIAGEYLKRQIGQALEKAEKLILVLSENSRTSPWVVHEIETALEIGRLDQRDVLIPVSLVDYESLKTWTLKSSDGKTDLMDEIVRAHVADFSNWEHPASFDASFEHFRRALRKLPAERTTDDG